MCKPQYRLALAAFSLPVPYSAGIIESQKHRATQMTQKDAWGPRSLLGADHWRCRPVGLWWSAVVFATLAASGRRVVGAAGFGEQGGGVDCKMDVPIRLELATA